MALADQTEIKFCRVCLAVDVKMYEMKEFQLRKMFQNITGIPACDETERVLYHVCWECAARLTAASAFRDKALFTDTLLKDLVHRNKRNIEQLRQYYSHLKSPLTVQTVFTSADIECEDSLIDRHRDETEKRKVYKRRTKRKSNEEEEEGTVFDEEEPLIELSVKTEIESDPIAENNINIQIKDENSETFSQVTHFDDTRSLTPLNDEIRNTEEHINEKSEGIKMIDAPIKYGIDFIEHTAEKQPTIDAIDNVFDEPSSGNNKITIGQNDSDIVLEENKVEENLMLDSIGNVSSSEEDAQSLAELVSVKKAMKQTSVKVGSSNKAKKMPKQAIEERLFKKRLAERRRKARIKSNPEKAETLRQRDRERYHQKKLLSQQLKSQNERQALQRRNINENIIRRKSNKKACKKTFLQKIKPTSKTKH